MDYEFLLIGASGFVGRSILDHLKREKRRFLALEHRRKVDHKNKISAPLWKVPCHALRSVKAVLHAARLAGSTPLRRFLVSLLGMWSNRRVVGCGYHGIVFLSGSLVYGEGEATERSPLRPISFQRHYVFQERPLLKAMEMGKRVSVIRPGWIVGCGSWFKKFYLSVMLKEGFVPLYGDGKGYMSLVNVGDVARFVVGVADGGIYGRVFNLAAEIMTREEFVEVLSEISSLPIRRVNVGKYDPDTATALTHSLILRSEREEVETFNFSPVRLELERCFKLATDKG